MANVTADYPEFVAACATLMASVNGFTVELWDAADAARFGRNLLVGREILVELRSGGYSRGYTIVNLDFLEAMGSQETAALLVGNLPMGDQPGGLDKLKS